MPQHPVTHHPPPLVTRAERLDALRERTLDVLVIGGGITGAGIALDLALRGVRVAVLERDDWAGATSSASSRLIHGGLRYLEQYELGLVRESCLERGLLLANAAGIVWPETFLFPVRGGDRVGRWKLAAGLGIYTLVSLPRVLGLPRMLSREAVRGRLPGIATRGLRGGGSYLDGATDDARLTLAVATSALEAGALALSRCEVRALENGAAGVEAEVEDRLRGERFAVHARAAVLAGGPFTEELRARAGLGGRWVQPTRGSHVVLPRRRLPTDGAVIFPSPVDGRVMFLIPWPRYTVVGTTDLDASASQEVRATGEEVRYLLDSANGLVPGAGLSGDDVVSTWAGLRPLLAAPESDPSARSREERVVREQSLYTIAGGKLTGYRAMAEKLCAQVARELGLGRVTRRSPTRGHRLRGAFDAPVARPAWSTLRDGAPDERLDALEVAHARRYAALAPAVRALCDERDGAQLALDPETLLGEVDWAVAHEDCLTADDFFARRTDLALGPVATARAAAPIVIERLAGLLGWDARCEQRERAELAASLDRRQRWRRD